MSNACTVDFADVVLEYASDAGDGRVRALDGLTLSVAAGEPIAIIGPSGCGKSTTLHMAAGLIAPTSGSVLVDGAPVEKPRQRTAFIPQDLGLFPWKTVYQNAATGLVIRKVPKQEVREWVTAALAEVGLSDFAQSYPKELSGGMKQRLALARAIALDMDLLLMDEPLSAIDALLRESLQDTLLDLWKRRGQTQILVTHSIEEAVYLGRRIVVLSARPGRLMRVIDNPGMGSAEYRDTAEFTDRCREVRHALAQTGFQPEAAADEVAVAGDVAGGAAAAAAGDAAGDAVSAAAEVTA